VTHLACLLGMSAWIDMSKSVVAAGCKNWGFFVWKQIQVGISGWVTKQGACAPFALQPARYR
jgi:hypothetical protein